MIRKILITDDDPTILTITRSIYKRNGFDVVTAGSGWECIQTLMEYPDVDILLLDIEMPGMNGIEVLKSIRDKDSLSQIKVIVMTSSTTKENVMDALHYGALEIIKKPFKGEELIAKTEAAYELYSSKETILVIDDDQTVIESIKNIFGYRYIVKSTTSGNMALETIKEERPNLILLDYHMPIMDGIHFLKIFFENPDNENIPVVMLTSDESAGVEVEAFKYGASDFIKKPIIPQIALLRVSRLLKYCRLQLTLNNKIKELELLQRKPVYIHA